METLQLIQRKIVDQSIAEARADLDRYLIDSPDDPEALYMMAVCHRLERQFDLAHDCLGRLQYLSPENGRAYQEEGHAFRDAGDLNRALTAYELACRFNPALLASWRERVRLLGLLGRGEESMRIKTQCDRLAVLPKPLLAARDLMSQGKLGKAEDLCRQFLQKHPDHVEGMRLLADVGVRMGVLDEAEFLLESAIAFQPDFVDARIDYIQVLRKRQKFHAARAAAEALLAFDPENPQFQSLYAIESMQTGDYDTALTVFDNVLERIPGEPATLTSKGHALKTVGRFDDAVDAYHEALIGSPNHGEAYYSLANLKTYRFDVSEIESMLASLELTTLSHMDRVYLHFALGKAFEDAADVERAFYHLEAGNHLKKAQSRYLARQMTDEFTAQKQVCDATLVRRGRDAGYPANDPIFIVGLPRSGSTLLEQILSSHSQVDGTLELPNILSYTHEIRRSEAGYPNALRELSDDELRAFGQRYIEETRIHRAGAPFFVDKMPNNFRHIGFIKMILPNARIIDARREPMSCCFSNFKQLFAEGQEFTYSLEDIARYYRDYVDLMDHWNVVLPGEVLKVQHEDVVDDLESQVARILDFCGLEFEASCVEFHKTERSVRTPSSEQVRQPIFRDSLEAWRKFEPWLEPLKQELGQDILRA